MKLIYNNNGIIVYTYSRCSIQLGHALRSLLEANSVAVLGAKLMLLKVVFLEGFTVNAADHSIVEVARFTQLLLPLRTQFTTGLRCLGVPGFDDQPRFRRV